MPSRKQPPSVLDDADVTKKVTPYARLLAKHTALENDLATMTAARDSLADQVGRLNRRLNNQAALLTAANNLEAAAYTAVNELSKFNWLTPRKSFLAVVERLNKARLAYRNAPVQNPNA